MLIDTYLDTASRSLTALRQAISLPDGAEAIKRIAHSLKSSSAMAGAPGLARLAAEMEARAASRQQVAATEVEALQQWFEDYRAALAEKGLLVA
jgi:HPt (histidine-containing phosphotransfer) domain-containing protein